MNYNQGAFLVHDVFVRFSRGHHHGNPTCTVPQANSYSLGMENGPGLSRCISY